MAVPRFTATADGAALREAYERDGVLIVEDFADAAARSRLSARIDELVADFDPQTVRTVFSTGSQSHAADSYFRDSGDKIRFFLEADAFEELDGAPRPKERMLNKIGHAMHDLDAEFSAFSRNPRLARLANGLGLEDPALVQSMVIFKQPRIGGEVGLHQDASFLHTEPVSVTGFWFALEDADEENGCLWAVPGGHRAGLAERFRYVAPDRLAMEPADDVSWDMDAAVPLPARAGTLVVLHGLLPHFSCVNRSPRSRLAYTLHVVDRRTRWSDDNWLRRAPDMPFRGFGG